LEIDKNIKIEIITDEDDTLKTLGELLANKTSRDLMKFLMSKSTYKMKISEELGVPFSLVEHHLKKLEKLGLVKITNKKLIKGGVVHKTYKITADGIFLMLNTTKKEIDEKGVLKKIFKDSVKFVAIGIVGMVTYFINFKEKIIESTPDIDLSTDNIIYSSNHFESLTISFGVIIIGLIFYIIIKKKKKRK